MSARVLCEATDDPDHGNPWAPWPDGSQKNNVTAISTGGTSSDGRAVMGSVDPKQGVSFV